MIINIGVSVLLIALFGLTPYIGRKGSAFGVLIGRVVPPEVKRLKFTYAATAVAAGAMLLSVIIAADIDYLYIAYIVFMLMLFARMRRLTQAAVKASPTKSAAGYYVQLPFKHLSVYWYAVYLPLVGAIFFVNRYGAAVVFTQCLTAALFFGFYMYVRYSKHYVDDSSPAESVRRNNIIRKRWEIVILAAGIVVLAAILLLSGIKQMD